MIIDAAICSNVQIGKENSKLWRCNVRNRHTKLTSYRYGDENDAVSYGNDQA